MTAADPYDVQGLLRAVAHVRPDLRPVLRVARYAHLRRKATRPPTERAGRRLSIARRVEVDAQPRCELGHFVGDRPCRGCRGQ